MILFYCPDTAYSMITLDAEESRHCVRAMRMGVGDEVCVTSGDGVFCHCTIVDADPRGCVVQVDRRECLPSRSFRLHLAVAPTKNIARLEWVLEKAVEIGVDEFTPVICDHSERASLHIDRLQRIAISALKQSQRAHLPVINAATPLSTLLQQPLPQSRLVCYCEGDQRRSLHECYAKGSDVVVLIGPEGDFSPTEIDEAMRCGFHPVTLGNTRLRTETAALYALTAINFINEQ